MITPIVGKDYLIECDSIVDYLSYFDQMVIPETDDDVIQNLSIAPWPRWTAESDRTMFRVSIQLVVRIQDVNSHFVTTHMAFLYIAG